MSLLNKDQLTILLVTLLSSPSWSTSIDELVERDGLYNKKFGNVPFIGDVTTGERPRFLKNGKKDNVWVEYLENGQLRSKGSFKNGVREGVWVSYYDNGQVKDEGNYKNGKNDGVWVVYNEEGTPPSLNAP